MASRGGGPLTVQVKTVLVIDDQGDILDGVRELIENGIPETKVVTAGNAQEALRVIGETKIDLLIVDYKMPGMNGIEFLQEIQRRGRSIPRFIITAYPDADLAEAAINNLQVEGFFQKPLRVREFVTAIDKELGKQRGSTGRIPPFVRP